MSQEPAETEAPTGFVKCPECGDIIKAKGKYGHFSRRHPELNYNEYKDKFVPTKPPEGAKVERPPGPVYKEEADANRILREILEKHPDITQRHTEEIMSWADLKGQLHPFEVAHLLSNMKGVSSQTASIVSQKYSVALTKAVSEGRAQIQMPLDFRVPPQVPQYPSMYGITQPPTYAPYQPMAIPSIGMPQVPGYPTYGAAGAGAPYTTPLGPRFFTEEDLKKAREEAQRDERLKKVEEVTTEVSKTVNELKKSIPEIIRQSIPTTEPEATYVEETIPIDAKGRPTHPEKAVTIKKIRKPFLEKTSWLDEYIKMKDAGLIPEQLTREDIRAAVKEEVKPEGVTVEKIREIIREEGKPSEKSPELVALETSLKDVSKRYDDLKETIEREDRKRLEDTIKDLKSRIESFARLPSGEFKSDEMKVISQTLAEIAGLLKTKKPMETLKEMVMPGGVPAVAQVPTETRTGILTELEKRGLVVER